jgi:hypothetical protein
MGYASRDKKPLSEIAVIDEAAITEIAENLDVAPIVTSYMEANNIRTPVKGVDYFDGHTPIKGVDYFDGSPGEKGGPGIDGKDGITQAQVMARQL